MTLNIMLWSISITTNVDHYFVCIDDNHEEYSINNDLAGVYPLIKSVASFILVFNSSEKYMGCLQATDMF